MRNVSVIQGGGDMDGRVCAMSVSVCVCWFSLPWCVYQGKAECGISYSLCEPPVPWQSVRQHRFLWYSLAVLYHSVCISPSRLRWCTLQAGSWVICRRNSIP